MRQSALPANASQLSLVAIELKQNPTGARHAWSPPKKVKGIRGSFTSHSSRLLWDIATPRVAFWAAA